MKVQIRIPAAIMVGILHVALALSLFTSVAAYGQSNDPCAAVAGAAEQQRALERQIANEPNPLRREDLKARLNQARSASIDASSRVKTANQGRFAGLTGRVTAFDPVSYNGSYGFVLVIALPCGTTVGFRFRKITNPAWGGMDPNDDTPLAPWRRALETIVVGDTVTVSGRFGKSFSVLTKLEKRGGPVYEVPDLLQLQERARAEEQQRKDAITQRLANELAGSWSGDWAMGGVLNPMATTSGNFVLQLTQDGSALTGTYIEKGGQSSITGSIRGRQLNIEYTYSDGSRRALAGNVDATGTVSGTWAQGSTTGTWKMAKSAPQSNTPPAQTGSAISNFECVRADNPSVTTTLVVDFTTSTVMSLNGFGGLRAATSAQITDATISWRNQVVKNYGGGGVLDFAGSIDRATRDFTFTGSDNSTFIFKCR